MKICSLLLALGLGFAHGQTLVWSKVIGNETFQSLKAIRTDAAGNILLFGTFTTYPMDTGTARKSFGSTDVFLHKMDPSGNTLWFRNLGSSGSGDKAVDMDLDSAGNAYVLADLNSSLGSRGMLLSGESDTVRADPGGARSVTIGKYDPSGKLLWIRQFENYNDAELWQIRACNGKVILAGYCYGMVRFLGFTDSLPSRGKYRGFWAELSGTGGVLSMGDIDSLETIDLVRPDGYGGLYMGSTKFLTGGPTYLERRRPNGEIAWRRPMVVTGEMLFQDLIADGEGNAYLGGRFEPGSRANLGGGRDTLVYSNKPPALYLLKLDTAGKLVWYNFGLDSYSPISNMTLAPDRSVTFMSFATGQTWRLDPQGKALWNFKASPGGIHTQYPPGTALDPDGSILFGVTLLSKATFLGHSFTNAGIENIVLFKVSGFPSTAGKTRKSDTFQTPPDTRSWWNRFLLDGRERATSR